MDTGDIHQKEGVIVNPENYEEMKKKYLEREEEQKQKLLQRHKIQTDEELKEVVSNTLATRSLRSEHQPLKDRKIISDAESENIKDLKKKLNEEIKQIGQKILGTLSIEEVESLEQKVVGLKDLKGRISKTQPPQNSSS